MKKEVENRIWQNIADTNRYGLIQTDTDRSFDRFDRYFEKIAQYTDSKPVHTNVSYWDTN